MLCLDWKKNLNKQDVVQFLCSVSEDKPVVDNEEGYEGLYFHIPETYFSPCYVLLF